MKKQGISKQKIKQAQSTNEETESVEFDWPLYSKFTSFMTKQRINFLNNKLFEFYGKNFCINYHPHYQFSEEWENEQPSYGIYNQSQYIWKVNAIGIFTSVIIMVMYSLCIWIRNIDYFFYPPTEKISWEPIYIIVMALQLPDAYLRTITQQCEPRKNLSLWKVLKTILPNLYTLLFLTVIVLGKDSSNSLIWFCQEVIGCFLLFRRAKNIYQSFRLTSTALNYEYHLKAIDLLITLFLISHLIAICLYQLTVFETGQTWLSALNLHSDTGITRYIYSVYFATTTVFTVGYGDICPKNEAEIFVLILVQSCGIIIIAYLMSEIGHTLSSMRKGRENLQKELTMMSKMKKYYNMSDELIRRARSYLIEEKPSVDHLSPEDENKLLMRFNQELRDEIKLNSSLSVVKGCIFFLCRWSKTMQTSVAAKLHSILLSPGELVYQPEGKERIYIIKLGKIDVYSRKKGNKKGNKQVLKTLKSNLQKQVSDNVYGYTAVVSTRPVRLQATAKQYTSGYYIQKNKFLECINERNTDFEYYHQIKSKIDQAQLWQSLEVPELMNSKHHYNPTRMSLFKKYQAQMNKGSNQRKINYRRNEHSNKTKKYQAGQLRKFINSIMDDLQSEQEINVTDKSTLQEISSEFEEKNQLIHLKEQLPKTIEPNHSCYQTSICKNLTNGKGTHQSTHRHNDHTLKDLTCESTLSRRRKWVTDHIRFEEAKQYSNYFSRKNLSVILQALQLREYVLGAAHLSKNTPEALTFYQARSSPLIRLIDKYQSIQKSNTKS